MNTGLALPWAQGGGIEELVLFLRREGFAVGPAEAIDAARVVAHLARTAPDAEGHADLAWLMPKLRPVLCKRGDEQERFEALFTEWSRLTIHPSVASPPAPSRAPVEAAPAPAAGRMPASRWLVLLCIALLTLAALYRAWTRPEARVDPPAPAASAPAPSPAPAPSEPPSKTDPARADRSDGHYPAVRSHWVLRPWVAGGLLCLGTLMLLGLAMPLALPWLGHARRRGRRLPLDLASLREEARRIVPPLQADTQARLERHVPGPAHLRERLQRRPPLHIGRTVEATLRHLGVLSLRYRTARLRPSYLLIVEVSAGADSASTEVLNDPRGRMFYRWAERLRRQGIDVEIRLARVDASGQALTCRPTGADWQLDGSDGEPLERLPTPPAGQRLVVVSDGNLLTDAQGQWRPWTQQARLHRWPQRAVFTPTEPRHWGPREDALERRERPADPGFYVLPLDESALAAWAELVVTGRLPRFTLSRAQRYPRRLRALEDAGQLERLLDPDHPIDQLPELLDQLRHYLGDNGYCWLAACAVPPIVRWELTLLLGEQYYLLAQVPPEELPAYIARDYPRLALLPWLRRNTLPDWLRLALLDSLSPRMQDEVREVVRRRLGQVRLGAGGDDALSLEEPAGPLGASRRPAAPPPRAGAPGRSEGDTLYLGYLAGHTPRQLMLRAPAEWRHWLGQLPTRQRAGLWADWLAALRDRLLWRQGLSFFGASPRALAWAGLGLWLLAGLAAALVLVRPADLPSALRELAYAEQVHAVTYPHEDTVWTATFSADGQRVATLSRDRSARLWEADTGRPIGAPIRHGSRVWSVVFSPDGRRLATGGEDATVRLWDAGTGQALGLPLRHARAVWQLAFSPDGQRLATVAEDNTARLWRTDTGAPLTAAWALGGVVDNLDLSPDGQRLLTSGATTRTRLWDATTGRALLELQATGRIDQARFGPDGLRVVTASDDQTARLWDAVTGQAIGAPMGHEGKVYHAAFSPDGRLVATASADGTARLWDAGSGQPFGPPLVHEAAVVQAAFRRDGRQLLTASRDGSAQVWDVATGQRVGPPLRHADRVNAAEFSADGRRIVTAGSDGMARLWSTDDGQAALAPLAHAAWVGSVAYSPDGTRLVTASGDQTARLWDSTTGQPIGVRMAHAGAVNHAAFGAKGLALVTASDDTTARVWNARTGQPQGTPLQHDGPVLDAAFSPDEHRLVTASADRTARLWDAATGQPLTPPLSHGGRVNRAAFSPDGRRIVTASDDGTARLWQADTGQPWGEPLRHEGAVVQARVSPDGRRVLTSSHDGTARLWSAETGQPLRTLRHRGKVHDASFSPDGRRIATASADGQAQVWDADTGRPIGQPLAHGGEVHHVGFSAEGRRVVTASADRSARVWDAATGQPVGTPLRHEAAVGQAVFSPDGEGVATAWGVVAPPPAAFSNAGPVQGPVSNAGSSDAAGGAWLWRVPPHPLPAWRTGPLAPPLAWALPAGAGTLLLLAVASLWRRSQRRRALVRLVDGMAEEPAEETTRATAKAMAK